MDWMNEMVAIKWRTKKYESTSIILFPYHKHLRQGHLAVVAVSAVRERLDE